FLMAESTESAVYEDVNEFGIKPYSPPFQGGECVRTETACQFIHTFIERAAGFTLADYRLELKCTSLRGWSLFRGAIPSSARSPESSRICGATLHLENEPAPSARQQASCLPRPPWPPQHRALRRRIWRSLRLCSPRRA